MNLDVLSANTCSASSDWKKKVMDVYSAAAYEGKLKSNGY